MPDQMKLPGDTCRHCGHYLRSHNGAGYMCSHEDCSCLRFGSWKTSGGVADPKWLTEAIAAAIEGASCGDISDAIRTALPTLRAGIEREVREQIAQQIEGVQSHMLSVPAAVRIVRGKVMTTE